MSVICSATYQRRPKGEEVAQNVADSTLAVREHRAKLTRSAKRVVSGKTEARKAKERGRPFGLTPRQLLALLPKERRVHPEVGERCMYLSHNATAKQWCFGSVKEFQVCNKNNSCGQQMVVVRRERKELHDDRRKSPVIVLPIAAVFKVARLERSM